MCSSKTTSIDQPRSNKNKGCSVYKTNVCGLIYYNFLASCTLVLILPLSGITLHFVFTKSQIFKSNLTKHINKKIITFKRKYIL
jgi:hypothetical protein